MKIFERIDHLVTTHGFNFQAWNDRYSKGIWAALGTMDGEVDTVRDLSSSGDLDMASAMDYIDSAQWLPYATGRTLVDAMTNLESVLAGLPSDQIARGTNWSTMVFNAIDALRCAERASDDYGGMEGRLRPLPATFEQALALARD